MLNQDESSFSDQNNQFPKLVQLDGLDNFKKRLEKDFFAEVVITPFEKDAFNCELTVEIHCNFDFAEFLYFFNQQYWNTKNNQSSVPEDFTLMPSLEAVCVENDKNVDIEELCLFLNDTSITINKLYKNSIAIELYTIFVNLSKHHVFISKGYTEMPYEIYLPVFEESPLNLESDCTAVSINDFSKENYFEYWGLYFEGSNEATIYNLSSKKIISGKLFMLNR